MAKTDKEVSHISHLSFYLQVYCFTETKSVNCKSKIFVYAQVRDKVYHSVLDKMELNYDSYQQNDKKFPL